MVVIEAQHAFGHFVEGGKDDSFVSTMRALREKPHLDGATEAWRLVLATLPDDDDAPDTAVVAAALDEGSPDAGDPPDPLAVLPGDAAGRQADGRWSGGLAARRWRHGVLDHLEVMLATRSLELRDAKRQLTAYVIALDAAARATPDSAGRWDVVHMAMELEGPARPEVFQRFFARTLARDPRIVVTPEALRLGDGYELRFQRLPLLDAFLEYLLSVPAPDDAMLPELDDGGPVDLGAAVKALFDALVRDLDGMDATARPVAIRDATNRLGKLVDRHLDGVVHRRDALERCRRITAVVEAHSPPGQLVFDDATLLRFWQTAALDPKKHGDYQLFRTALGHFVQLARELVAAQQTALYRREAASLYLAVASELDMAGLVATAEPSLAAFAPGGALAPLRLFNNTEQAELALLVTIGRVVDTFARSLLRGETFGPVQSRMVEAKRQRNHDLLDRLAALEELPDDAYDAVRGRLADHAAHLRKLLLAAVAVAGHHDPAFLDRGFASLGDAAASAERDRLVKQAKTAFAGIRRAGFRDALREPALGELFVESVPVLSELAALVDTALAAIDREAAVVTLPAQLAEDRSPFCTTLAQLKES